MAAESGESEDEGPVSSIIDVLILLAKYPIVPTLEHWRFLHSGLPEFWTNPKMLNIPPERQIPRLSTLSTATLARNISWRISRYIESTERAHLIPRSEELWYVQNGMSNYTVQSQPGTEYIDDPKNAILLRSDLRLIFD